MAGLGHLVQVGRRRKQKPALTLRLHKCVLLFDAFHCIQSKLKTDWRISRRGEISKSFRELCRICWLRNGCSLLRRTGSYQQCSYNHRSEPLLHEGRELRYAESYSQPIQFVVRLSGGACPRLFPLQYSAPISSFIQPGSRSEVETKRLLSAASRQRRS